MKFSGLFLHALTFPLQNWISSHTTLRQGLAPLWVGPCFKPWSGVNWNLPRFSLILHLLNTLAFYSALDSSLLYVNEVNGFFIHFRRILQGWFQSKSVMNYAQRAVALPFIISAKKHSPPENDHHSSWYFQAWFFSPWGSREPAFTWPSVLCPRCFILQAFQYAFEFFILGQSSEVMLASDPILLGQNMRFRSFISIRPFINKLADGCASVGWRG